MSEYDIVSPQDAIKDLAACERPGVVEDSLNTVLRTYAHTISMEPDRIRAAVLEALWWARGTIDDPEGEETIYEAWVAVHAGESAGFKCLGAEVAK